MEYVFPPGPMPAVAIAGSAQRFPVHRIYCVGRNYASHNREVGNSPKGESPVFFTKPADAVVADGAMIDYPPRTDNLQHEIELVVAIGRQARAVTVAAAQDVAWGYAVGNDLTRRDLLFAARDSGRPWDTGKAFDQSAAISAIQPVSAVGHISAGRIWLRVNGELRQEADLSQLIWKVPELIAELSCLFELRPGDLLFTGTPAGIGPLLPGDRIAGGIDGLGTLSNTIRGS